MPGEKRNCAGESEQKERHDRSSESVAETVRRERQVLSEVVRVVGIKRSKWSSKSFKNHSKRRASASPNDFLSQGSNFGASALRCRSVCLGGASTMSGAGSGR